MSKDGNLRAMFRSNLRDIFWTSIETSTEPGVPDSFFCCSGVMGWLEFKKIFSGERVPSLTPTQVMWHARLARKGGRSFFAVRRSQDLLLIPGDRGGIILKKGLTAAEPTVWSPPWPWKIIKAALLRGP